MTSAAPACSAGHEHEREREHEHEHEHEPEQHHGHDVHQGTSAWCVDWEQTSLSACIMLVYHAAPNERES